MVGVGFTIRACLSLLPHARGPLEDRTVTQCAKNSGYNETQRAVQKREPYRPNLIKGESCFMPKYSNYETIQSDELTTERDFYEFLLGWEDEEER